MAGNASGVAKKLFKFLMDPAVHQQFQTYVVPVAKGFYAWYNGSSKQNKTVEEIEVRHRQQATETADERERRTANQQEALEEQQREEEELAKNEESIALRITEKKRELLWLQKEISQLGEQYLLFQAEQKDARARAAEDEGAGPAATEAEKSRIEVARMPAEAAEQVQETNRTEEKKRTEAPRMQLVRDLEGRTAYELDDRWYAAAKQATEERGTDADKKQWDEAAKAAEETKQRIEDQEQQVAAAMQVEKARRSVEWAKKAEVLIRDAEEQSRKQMERRKKDEMKMGKFQEMQRKIEQDLEIFLKAMREAKDTGIAEQDIREFVERMKEGEEERRKALEKANNAEVESNKAEEKMRKGMEVMRKEVEDIWKAEELRKARQEVRKAEEELRNAEEELRNYKEELRKLEEEKQRIETARQVEEAKRTEEERRSTEAANQERKIDDANKLQAAIERKKAAALEVADLKEARRQNTGKIGLAMWPHPAEYEAAKEKIQYDPSTFMFAIAGFTGTGKTSLINIFLDRDPPMKDAEMSNNDGAHTGTSETTSEITRYPDPGDKPPRKWIVWYDVPGGGTINIPEKEYFNHQSLFLMDVILVLIGNRFTSIDVQILKQCRAFGIPSMIIRSNTDTHIANMVQVRAERLDVEPNDALRSKCRAEYIADTRDNIAVQLQKHSLPPQYVYLVTCLPSKQFRKAYSAFAGGAPYEGTSHFIDEMKLILDLTIAANRRRGRGMAGDEGGTPRDVTVGSSGSEGLMRETGSTAHENQSQKQLLQTGVEDEATRISQSKQYGRSHQPETTDSQSSRQPEMTDSPLSTRKYILPVRRFPTQSTSRSNIVKSDSRETAPPNEPAIMPVQAAIATIQLAFSRTSPLYLSLEIIRNIDIEVDGAQLLVLSLNRNLAIHIHGIMQTLATPMALRSVVCVGGGREPKCWQHIITGTPARVGNFVERGSLKMENIRILILNMGPIIPQDVHQQIYDVYRHLPSGVKILRGVMDLSSRSVQ